MKAGKLALLLLILGFGAAVETAWSVRHSHGFGPLGCRVLRGKFYGPSFSFDEQETRKLAAGASVEVENAFGAVSMSQGAVGEVRTSLRKVVYLGREEDARAYASGVRLIANETGTGLRISTNRDELGRDREVGLETHLEVAVPPGTAVRIRNEHGRVEVRDVARAEVSNSFDALRVERVAGDAVIRGRHGDVTAIGVGGALSITARHGEVQVEDVGGRGTLKVEHGDAAAVRTGALDVELAHGQLQARGVRGDLELRGKHAGVDAEDVDGRVQVDTAYRGVRLAKVSGDARVKVAHGELDASDVKGGVVAEVSYDDVSLARIAGPVEVTVSHGGLRAEAIENGAKVKASGDDVILDRFRGAVEVEAQRGGVQLQPAGALAEPVTVSATNGGIRLEVPAGSRFRLEASTRRGGLDVDVPGLSLTLSDRDRVTGTVGGGGQLVRLTADHGDVTVSAAAAVAAKEP